MNLPVFVYGTLRTGLHNYERILKGLTEEERSAVMTGRLYAASHEPGEGRSYCNSGGNHVHTA
ncbi:gamma-glutamylcyclotransferase [Salibacterium sp. K-3]